MPLIRKLLKDQGKMVGMLELIIFCTAVGVQWRASLECVRGYEVKDNAPAKSVVYQPIDLKISRGVVS